MLAAIYTRVSTDEQVEHGTSLANQEESLREYCLKNGLVVYKKYTDEGLSGFYLDKRPGALQMLEDAQKKKFDVLVISKIDRLCRNTKELLTIVDILNKNKIEFISLAEALDPTTSSGYLQLTIQGSFAQFERDRISQRTNVGKYQRTKEGYMIPQGPPAFGYRVENKHFIPNEHAWIVKYIFEEVAKGRSIHNLCIELNERGLVKRWYPRVVLAMIRNTIYKGYAHLNNQGNKWYDSVNVKANNVEAIVDEDTWEKANRYYTGTKPFPKKKNSDKYYFASALYCECGSKMCTYQVVENGHHYYYYQCRAKMNTFGRKNCYYTLSTSKMNKRFMEGIKDLNFDTVEPETEPKIDYTSSLKALDDKKKRATAKLIEGLIEDEDYRYFVKQIEDERKVIEAKMQDQIANEQVAAKFEYLKDVQLNLLECWNEMTDKERTLFVVDNIERIVVNKNEILEIEFK